MIAAFLWAQLEHLDEIQAKRLAIWERYNETLETIAYKANIRLPFIPEYATNNAHMYYIIANNEYYRDKIIRSLKENNIQSVIHYQSLHKSKFYKDRAKDIKCPQSDYYSECLLRLPLYFELNNRVFNQVLEAINAIN